MAKKPNIVRALVTQPTYINGVLHQPGEVAHADLDALGIDQLGENEVEGPDGKTVKADLTPGLKPYSGKDAEPIDQAPVAAVAPHAPDAPNPQGLPTGTVISGTGRHIVPDLPQGDEEVAAVEPVGADKPGVAGEQTPTKPTKGK